MKTTRRSTLCLILATFACSCETTDGRTENSFFRLPATTGNSEFNGTPLPAAAKPICPARRPVETEARMRSLLPKQLEVTEPVILVVPGYFATEVGTERGRFDAAFFLLSTDGIVGFRGNSRPAKHGWNPQVQRWYPTIQGEVLYRVGTYVSYGDGKRHDALVDGYTTVRRDDGEVQSGYFGCHMHSARSNVSVSSTGCLTVPKCDWDDLFGAIRKLKVEKIRVIVLPRDAVWPASTKRY